MTTDQPTSGSIELLLAKLAVLDVSPLTLRLLRYVLTEQLAGRPVSPALVPTL